MENGKMKGRIKRRKGLGKSYRIKIRHVFFFLLGRHVLYHVYQQNQK